MDKKEAAAAGTAAAGVVVRCETERPPYSPLANPGKAPSFIRSLCREQRGRWHWRLLMTDEPPIDARVHEVFMTSRQLLSPREFGRAAARQGVLVFPKSNVELRQAVRAALTKIGVV